MEESFEGIPNIEMLSKDLYELSAKEVVRLLKNKVVTPHQLIDVVESRIAKMEPTVHATPITCFDRARAAASKMEEEDKRYKGPGYLHGLPILIKDLHAVKDVAFVRGCKFNEHDVAEKSDPIVEQLEAMGAIIVGKTNVPEYGAGGQTFNEVFPTTVVPLDHKMVTPLTAGGSSGGSAAALAAKECWLATGTDLGGSLRTPAAFCGVLGFRVSPGLMQWDDPSLLEQELHVIDGPMARNVGDLALLLDALTAQPDCKGTGKSWQDFAEEGLNMKFNVAYSTLGCNIIPEVEEICKSAADRLHREGIAVKVKKPFDVDCAQKCFHFFRADIMSQPTYWPDGKKELLKPETQWNISIANNVGGLQTREAALELSLELFDEMRQFFSRPDAFDILAVPTTLDGAFDSNIRYPISGFGCGNTDFSNYLSWLGPVCLISMTNCPALSLPVGRLADGRHVGIQLIAAPGQDGKVLAAAACLEASIKAEALPPVSMESKADTASRKVCGPQTEEEARTHHMTPMSQWQPLENNPFQVHSNGC